MGILIPIDTIPKSGPPEFERVLALCRKELQPRGAQEMALVEQMAYDRWMLARIHHLKASLSGKTMGPEPPDDSPDGATAVLLKAA